MENKIYDTVIIGSGPAGLTAAIYNIRADLKTVVVAGNQPGGQLIITTLVDNYPGFPEGIGGVKLMMDMTKQVENLGGKIVNEKVVKVEKKGKIFEVILGNNEVMETRAVIVTTGAKAKWLGLPKEKVLVGRGVSGCATCDGMFFRDKIISIVGGGDTACTEADFLSRFGKEINMIHRRDSFRASAAEQKNVLNNPKIKIWWNTEVVEIVEGEGKLKAVKLKNNQTGEEKILETDGLFVAIGREPETSFLEGLGVELNEIGKIVVGKNKEFQTMTNVEGVLAAGDCTNNPYMQAIIAAGDGCKAGLEAEKWLKIG